MLYACIIGILLSIQADTFTLSNDSAAETMEKSCTAIPISDYNGV